MPQGCLYRCHPQLVCGKAGDWAYVGAIFLHILLCFGRARVTAEDQLLKQQRVSWGSLQCLAWHH